MLAQSHKIRDKMYHARMFGIFAYVSHLSEDKSLTSIARQDLVKASNKILEGKPLVALLNLTNARAMCHLSGANAEPYVLASEGVATAIITNAQSLDELTEVRKILGPYVKKVETNIMLLAREIGLKAMLADREERATKASKE